VSDENDEKGRVEKMVRREGGTNVMIRSLSLQSASLGPDLCCSCVISERVLVRRSEGEEENDSREPVQLELQPPSSGHILSHPTPQVR